MYKDVAAGSTIGLNEQMIIVKRGWFVVFTCQSTWAAAEPGVVLVPTIPDNCSVKYKD